MKKLAIAFAVLAVAAAAGVFWLDRNVDGLIRDGIARYGSEMTQARVDVGGVELRSRDGAGRISDLTLGNPRGFRTAYALKAHRIEFSIDIESLPRDVIVVRKVLIDAPDIIYEKGDAITNFDALQRNVAAYLGSAAGKSESGKKFIIEEFVVRGARAQASAGFMEGRTVSVSLADIVLRDLGKAKGGLPPGELGREAINAIKQKLASAISFERLAKSTGQALEKVGTAIKGLFQ